MKILLAGATGAIGKVLLPLLADAGHTVFALTRTPTAAERLRARGVAAIVTDVMNRDQVLSAVAGLDADAVVHQATAIAGIPMRHRDLHATDALRDVGTSNLIEAAQAVGAQKFVTQSFYLGYGWSDHGEIPLTEDAPFGEPDGSPFDTHLRSLRSNEEQVLGVGGIALRYGMFYGPEPMTWRMMRSCRRRVLPAPRPSGTTHPIHLNDAASATVAALEHGRAGNAYNIADDHPLGMDEYLDALAQAARAPHPQRIPGSMLRPLPYLHALMVKVKIKLDTTKAKRDLGWKPQVRTCYDGLPRLAPGPG